MSCNCVTLLPNAEYINSKFTVEQGDTMCNASTSKCLVTTKKSIQMAVDIHDPSNFFKDSFFEYEWSYGDGDSPINMEVKCLCVVSGFYLSKFLMGDSKFSVPVGARCGWSWMWGDLRKKSDWSQNCPLNAKLSHFCYFMHEIQLFKVLFSLKVVKFDTKMYLNFSNFRGRTSAGGGGEQALVQKWGQVLDGGDWQNFRRMGDPQYPPEKKTPGYKPFQIALFW